jgi:hypothetical protein
MSAYGCTDSVSTTIGVVTSPTPVLSGSGTYCAAAALSCFGETGHSYQLQDALTQAVGMAQTGANAPLTFPVTATGVYTVIATDAATGCTAASDAQTVAVSPVGAATITGDASNTCPDTTVALTASATGATSFTWYKDGTPVQTGASDTYSVTESGTYTVQGKNANCIGSASSSTVATINDCLAVPGCPGFRLYQTTATHDGQANWGFANSYCTSRGARLPTVTELDCMCKQKGNLPIDIAGYESDFYWSSTQFMYDSINNIGYYEMRPFNNCAGFYTTETTIRYFRCVVDL